jgi:hypothetical protein
MEVDDHEEGDRFLKAYEITATTGIKLLALIQRA